MLEGDTVKWIAVGLGGMFQTFNRGLVPDDRFLVAAEGWMQWLKAEQYIWQYVSRQVPVIDPEDLFGLTITVQPTRAVSYYHYVLRVTGDGIRALIVTRYCPVSEKLPDVIYQAEWPPLEGMYDAGILARG